MLLKRALAHHFERLLLIWADGGYAGNSDMQFVVSMTDSLRQSLDQRIIGYSFRRFYARRRPTTVNRDTTQGWSAVYFTILRPG